jgi:hypothetical protein
VAAVQSQGLSADALIGARSQSKTGRTGQCLPDALESFLSADMRICPIEFNKANTIRSAR